MPPKEAPAPTGGEADGVRPTVESVMAREPQAEGPWWFSVKYGEDVTALFNMDCWSCTLIAHIKEKCGYEALPEDIDLQKDAGGMVELHTHGRASARELLTPKATYILCKMAVAEDAPEGTAPTPEMLWTPPEGYVAPAAAPPKKK